MLGSFKKLKLRFNQNFGIWAKWGLRQPNCEPTKRDLANENLALTTKNGWHYRNSKFPWKTVCLQQQGGFTKLGRRQPKWRIHLQEFGSNNDVETNSDGLKKREIVMFETSSGGRWIDGLKCWFIMSLAYIPWSILFFDISIYVYRNITPESHLMLLLLKELKPKIIDAWYLIFQFLFQWPFQDPKWEVPTIYKAYFSGLCKGISPQNMAKHRVRLRTSINWILEFISHWLLLGGSPHRFYPMDFPHKSATSPIRRQVKAQGSGNTSSRKAVVLCHQHVPEQPGPGKPGGAAVLGPPNGPCGENTRPGKHRKSYWKWP